MALKAGRDWILTVSAEKHTLDEVREKLSKYRWAGQLEQGSKSGFRHYQIGIFNDAPIRFATLQSKFGDAHIEPRQGTRQELFDYVTKDDTRIDGPWSGGDWSDRAALLRVGTQQGKRSDLAAVRAAVESGMSYKQILLSDEVSVSSAHAQQWLRETIEAKRETMQSGQPAEKTVLYGCSSVLDSTLRDEVYEIFEPDKFFEVEPGHPFDHYDGEAVLVFPDFDWRAWPLDFILKLCDKYPVKLPARYSNKQSMAQTIIFLSHEPITAVYKDVLGEARAKLFGLIDQYLELYRDGQFFNLPLKGLMKSDSSFFEPLFSQSRPWHVEQRDDGKYMLFSSGGEGSESLPLLIEGQETVQAEPGHDHKV